MQSPEHALVFVLVLPFKFFSCEVMLAHCQHYITLPKCHNAQSPGKFLSVFVGIIIESQIRQDTYPLSLLLYSLFSPPPPFFSFLEAGRFDTYSLIPINVRINNDREKMQMCPEATYIIDCNLAVSEERKEHERYPLLYNCSKVGLLKQTTTQRLITWN